VKGRKNMKEEVIEGLNIWLPKEIGETLQGEITAIEQDAQFGIQATVKKDDGASVQTPSHKWLQNCIKVFKVKQIIKIEYLGEQPPSVKGQSPLKKYKVSRLTE
jgi:hypothetical protein